jgi:hypothetical protein
MVNEADSSKKRLRIAVGEQATTELVAALRSRQHHLTCLDISGNGNLHTVGANALAPMHGPVVDGCF